MGIRFNVSEVKKYDVLTQPIFIDKIFLKIKEISNNIELKILILKFQITGKDKYEDSVYTYLQVTIHNNSDQSITWNTFNHSVTVSNPRYLQD